MILLEQKLIAQTPNSTASVLEHNGKWLGFIIEDGSRDTKEFGMTRIPAGEYRIKPKEDGKFFTRYKQLYGHSWVPKLEDVPGFEQILIHSGNFTTDTDGCLLINTTLGYMEKTQLYYGGGSKDAYKKLYTYLDQFRGEIIKIRITR